MFADFDVNQKINVISILQFSQDGTRKIISYDLATNRRIKDISNEYQPLGPRLSPNEGYLAFFDGINSLYLWDMENDNIKTIFKNPYLDPGFCEWSLDGNQICFSAYSTNPNNKTPPDIYLKDLKTKKIIQLTDSSDSVDRFPQWSPSNQFIVFQRQYLDEPNNPKKVFLVDTKTKLCSAIPHSVNSNHHIGRYCWSKDSAHLLVKEVSNKDVYLKVFRISNMVLEWTFFHPEIVGCAFLTKGERILVVCKKELLIVSFPKAEILRRYSLPDNSSIKETLRGPSISLSSISNMIYFLNEDSCLYRLNEKDSFELLFKESEEQLPYFIHQEYSVRSKDGRNIPVHLFIPKRPKSLSVLFVHGGPGERVDDKKDPLILRLLEEGYEVIVPAYRGCAGYGDEHKNANIGEYGRADVWDLLAVGLDWKKRTQYKRPLSIMGYSYGGYLTFLSLSFPQVPWDCGITLWGVTRIEHLGLQLPKAYPKDQTERKIAKSERNPLVQANKIRTPLLILHGGKDTTSTNDEVKFIQKQIQSQKGVCDLVIYHDGTHGLGKHRKEMFEEVFNFLEKY